MKALAKKPKTLPLCEAKAKGTIAQKVRAAVS